MGTLAARTDERIVADFEAFAEAYGRKHIAVCPLVLDDDGRPKKPASEHYPKFKPDENQKHDWREAEGLGIVLGKPSGNLAVIDVDDLGLAEYLRRGLASGNNPPLMAETARGRLHVYVTEPEPSIPLDLAVSYSGRRVLVQLLAAGCLAAAPPTPGYRWLNSAAQPLFGNVRETWRRVALDFKLPYIENPPHSLLERRERSRGPTSAQIRQGLR